MKAGRCFAQTVAALAGFTAARAAGLLGPARCDYLAIGLLTAGLALIAWTAGAIASDLGLSRTDLTVRGWYASRAACMAQVMR